MTKTYFSFYWATRICLSVDKRMQSIVDCFAYGYA